MEETVYAVAFKSITLDEVLAIYNNREAAQAHADFENEGVDDPFWRVVEWSVGTIFDRPGEDG